MENFEDEQIQLVIDLEKYEKGENSVHRRDHQTQN